MSHYEVFKSFYPKICGWVHSHMLLKWTLFGGHLYFSLSHSSIWTFSIENMFQIVTIELWTWLGSLRCICHFQKQDHVEFFWNVTGQQCQWWTFKKILLSKPPAHVSGKKDYVSTIIFFFYKFSSANEHFCLLCFISIYLGIKEECYIKGKR